MFAVQTFGTLQSDSNLNDEEDGIFESASFFFRESKNLLDCFAPGRLGSGISRFV
jgi:hypothetical protein